MTAKRTSRFSPTLEALEDRQLLSWSSVPPSWVNLNAPEDYHYNISFGTAGGYAHSTYLIDDEVDFRTFVAPRTGTYTFEARAVNGSSIDTVAALFDANGYRLAYNDDSGGTYNSKFTVNLTAGRAYNFGITNYINSSAGDYQAVITSPSISSSDWKSGTFATGGGWNSSGTATLSRSTLSLQLSGTNSSPWTATHTHTVTVRIYDVNGQLLFQNIWTGSLTTAGSSNFSYPSSASRTWTFDLSAFDLGRASSLSVSVS
jgi:hypothetical protein